jgi:hypothetical protein
VESRGPTENGFCGLAAAFFVLLTGESSVEKAVDSRMMEGWSELSECSVSLGSMLQSGKRLKKNLA